MIYQHSMKTANVPGKRKNIFNYSISLHNNSYMYTFHKVLQQFASYIYYSLDSLCSFSGIEMIVGMIWYSVQNHLISINVLAENNLWYSE